MRTNNPQQFFLTQIHGVKKEYTTPAPAISDEAIEKIRSSRADRSKLAKEFGISPHEVAFLRRSKPWGAKQGKFRLEGGHL